MSFRIYQLLKFGVVAILAGLIIWAVDQGNAWIPIPAAIIAVVILLLIRRGVKEVVVDERTYSIAEKASRITFQAGAIVMVFVGITLGALSRSTHPDLGPIADTLIFSAIGLTLMYMMSYLYYSGKLGGGGKE